LDDAVGAAPGITTGAHDFDYQGINPSIRGFFSRADLRLTATAIPEEQHDQAT
jgi:hypothetical protein